jgi:hypothetical protein
MRDEFIPQGNEFISNGNEHNETTDADDEIPPTIVRRPTVKPKRVARKNTANVAGNMFGVINTSRQLDDTSHSTKRAKAGGITAEDMKLLRKYSNDPTGNMYAVDADGRYIYPARFRKRYLQEDSRAIRPRASIRKK